MRILAWILLALPLACAGGADALPKGGGSPTEAELESHRRMLATLAEIARATPDANDYLGDRNVRALRAELASTERKLTPADRVDRLIRLAMEELRIGEPESAIETLAEARALVDGDGTLDPATAARSRPAILYYQGIANLRWGETQNCVAMHTSRSCILPIRGDGVHKDQQGSRRAIVHLQEVLDAAPGIDVRAAAGWLLNIAYMTVGEYPDGVPAKYRIPERAFASDQPFPHFTDVAPELGLNAFDLSGGAIVDDFDGDGRFDIVSSTWDTSGPMHFYRNAGDGTFVERTEEANLGGLLGGLNMKQADYDNDGDLDILVLRGAWLLGSAGQHPNSLLRNDGNAVFTDVTFVAGLAEVSYPTQAAAWADYDGDGDLDLYVGNEATPEHRFPGQLFVNDGKGHFVDRAAEAGVENLRYAKGVDWGDYDNDGDPDLYVSNLGGDNRLYRNEGNGRFTDVAKESGVAGPNFSFPLWFWDYDNDGNLDLFVSSYYQSRGPDRIFAVAAGYIGAPHRAESPRIYRGDGKGGFSDVAARTKAGRVSMPMGSNFGDLDNDGWLDFYLGTGYPDYDGVMPNVMFRNVEGRGFADVTVAGGFGHLQKGHAVSFADLDNDGDADVFEQMGGAYPGDAFGNVLYENPGFDAHWIRVRLVGKRANRFGVGARLRVDVVENGKPRSIHRVVTEGGSFGASPLEQHVGIGKATRVERIEVRWPGSGRVQTLEGVEADRAIEIVEGESGYRTRELPAVSFR